MIGVFDSGLGGVHTAKYFRKILPEYDYFVLADNEHLPYGDKSPQWIHDRVFHCLHWMFDQGCGMVILACNTASAFSIHHRQAVFPNKKVLSVSVPGIESVIERSLHHVAVFGTQATIDSNIYPMLFERYFINYPLVIEQVPSPSLVGLIERFAGDEIVIDEVRKYCSELSNKCEAAILGCTHYPIIEHLFATTLGPNISIIDPGLESAKKLVSYLSRHKEIESTLSKRGGYLFVESKTTLI